MAAPAMAQPVLRIAYETSDTHIKARSALVFKQEFEKRAPGQITVPIFLPVLKALDINLVHFAIIVVVNMELGVITPPVGMNLFAISAISRTPVQDVFRGTLPSC